MSDLADRDASVLETEVGRLNRVADELRAVVKELTTIQKTTQPIYSRQARIRHYLMARRARQDIIGREWFADPVWDILLDLLANEIEGRRVSITSACLAASVPTTTGLRCIRRLIDAGVLIGYPDPTDSRRSFLKLSHAVADKLAVWVERNLPGGGIEYSMPCKCA